MQQRTVIVKLILIIVLLTLLVGTVSASKITIYNPFGKHLQYYNDAAGGGGNTSGTCSSGTAVQNITTGGNFQCVSLSGSGGDITAVNTNGDYLSGGSTSGDVNLLWNETKGNLTYINTIDESNLNVNQSTYWGLLNLVSQLTNTHLHNLANITGMYTHLSNFTDDLGDRGYTVLSNFTNDIGLINETFANDTYVNVDGDNMSGVFRYADSTVRLDNDTNLFFFDTEDEAKHLNSFAENYDKLRANVFTSDLTIETFVNATGSYINISTSETKIRFIISDGTTAKAESFDYNNITLPLIEGNNTNPILNRVYAYLNSGVPTWAVITSEPVVQHAMASRILIGDNASTIYAAGLQEDGMNGFLKRTQRRFRKEGLLYEEGLDYSLLVDNIYIGEGNFINGVYDQKINGVNLSTDGFYLVRTDGTYQSYSSLSDITEYSGGTSIGNNKYYNIVFGITPYDGTGNLYAVVQSKPTTEYTSMINAYADSDNTLKVLPSEDFLKLNFLPVVRVIVNSASDELQVLPSGNLGEDYRGGIAGGVSSGGGLSESDPLSIHFDGSIPLISNWDAGSFNITASSFNGNWNGSILYLLNTGDTATGNYTFDTNTLHIDSTNDMVGIGTVSPGSELEIVDVSSSAGLFLTSYGAATGNRGLILTRSSEGTEASPTAISTDRNMGSFTVAGYNGASFVTAGNFKYTSVEAFNSSQNGVKFEIQGTNTGETTQSDWLTILDGDVGIGTTTPENSLHIADGGRIYFTDPEGNGKGQLGQEYLNLVNEDGSANFRFDSIGNVGKFTAYRGNNNYTDPTALNASDEVFKLNIRGHDGDGYSTISDWSIGFETTEQWNSTNHGNAIVFDGTNDGASYPSEWMRLTDGKVGIGTTSPTVPLDVVGNIASTGTITSNGGGLYLFKEAASGANRVTVYSDNTIHWGGFNFYRYAGTQTVPTQVLDNTEISALNTRVYDGSSLVGPTSTISTRTKGDINSTNRGTEMSFYGTSEDSTTRTEWMTLTDGNVGIGTTTPTNPLTINGVNNQLSIQASGTERFRANVGAGVFDFNTLPDSTSDSNLRFFRLTNTTGDVKVQFFKPDGLGTTDSQIGVNGIDSFFQTNGGNFGIGTDTPTKALEVYNNVSGNHTMFVNNPSTDSAARAQMFLTSGEVDILLAASSTGVGFYGTLSEHPMGFITNDKRAMTIDVDGNVGIGITTPGSELEVVGTITGGKNLISLYSNSNSASITTNSVNVSWDAQIRKDDYYTHSTSTNPDQVVVTEPGDYMLSVDVSMGTSSGSARSGGVCYVTADGVEIDGTRTHLYLRGTNIGYNTGSINRIVTLADNDIVSVVCAREHGTDTLYVDADGSRFNLEWYE